MMALVLAAALITAATHQAVPDAAVPTASFLDEKPVLAADPPRSLAQAVGMTAAVLMMAAGAAAVFVRSQKTPRPAALGDKINLLAFKPIGGKQRLALVEVCGERLLLSANEREVTLLSHLPGPAADEPVEAVASQAAVDAADRPVHPVGQTVADLEQALRQTPQRPQSNPNDSVFNSDLAGLQQWQHRAQSERRA